MNVFLDMHFDKCSPQFMIRCLRYYVTEYHVDGFLLNTAVVSEIWLHEDPILRQIKILGAGFLAPEKWQAKKRLLCSMKNT